MTSPPFAPAPLRALHLVSHTHWDREWYHTAERFRQRLVRLIDELLDASHDAAGSFLLDGQAVLLDDYLAVRPERTAELSALLRAGRVEAGPWYVLADELLPGGEALVRNLLLGRDTVRRLRGDPPSVLYCPDSFGHPAALPDIARGFGCDTIVLWRGYGGSRWPAGDTARWTGPSGHSVVAYHLTRDGYEFGSSLPATAHEAKARADHIVAEFTPRSRTGVALLLNGADHHAPQTSRDEAVTLLAQMLARPDLAPSLQLLDSTLGQFAADLQRAAANVTLPHIAGELRDSYGYTWSLQGTAGTRAAQKRRAAQAERVLVRDVEPWLALERGAGTASARGLLRAAWRELLLAHPHDTLCGTSIDAVAAAFDARLASVESQSDGLRDDALERLLEHDADHARLASSSWRPALVLRNPSPRWRRGVVFLTLEEKLADVAVGPGSSTRQGVERAAAGMNVPGMLVQPLRATRAVMLTEAPRAYPDADLVAITHALGWCAGMDGYTVATHLHDAGRVADVPHAVVVTEHSLDNGLLNVSIADDGGVRLTHRQSGRVIDGLITFESRGDEGDLYTPSLRDVLMPPRYVGHELVHRGPLRGELALHYATPGSTDHPEPSALVITLALHADSPLLRVGIEGHNRARDHRLRLHIATGLAHASTLADAAFHPVARSPLSISAADAAMEHVVPTAPLHRWVTRSTASFGVTLFSDGLAEYESLDDGAVAVTLVRAVGALSRHDLPERPGHAGWPRETPAAQSLGPFAASLGLALHGPSSPETLDEVERLADDFLLPITGRTLRSNVNEAKQSGGLALRGDGLAFSAAMPSHQHGWMTLRCVNRRDHAVEGRWTLRAPPVEAVYARLDETVMHPAEVTGSDVLFTAAPREIVTILVRP